MTTPIAVNLSAQVETPHLSGWPYRVDVDGRPYVPVGDGGIVLGVRLGDSVFATDADHAAPGACLVHADPAARLALTSFACLGNVITVRGGAAAGARGVVLGQRGEGGRVIGCFTPDVLAALAPGDAVVVRGYGSGASLPGVSVLNLDPAALGLLPVTRTDAGLAVSVRASVASHVVGNGIGRPAEQWDLDLQVDAESPGTTGLRLGDLVAITDLDVRYNAGYRRGWVTVGVVVHGASPQPGHGPGVTPLFCGPPGAIDVSVDEDHRGLAEPDLLGLAR